MNTLKVLHIITINKLPTLFKSNNSFVRSFIQKIYIAPLKKPTQRHSQFSYGEKDPF